MAANRPGFVLVTNTHRDTAQLRMVWKTANGQRPTEAPASEAGKPGKPVESYQLHLGSDDDDNEAAREQGVLQPTQEVPHWAVEVYRKAVPLFASWEESGKIRVHRAA